MATTSATVTTAATDLQELAKRHLWMHFTRQGAYDERRRPDHRPRRGAATCGTRRATAIWTASPPSSASTPATAGRSSATPRRARSRSSTSSPIWSYAHPRAIELSARIASLAPGDLNRVFFTSGGSEAVESAIKLARAYHQRTGNPRKTKFISREIAYHGTTLGRPRGDRHLRRFATSSSRSCPAASRCRTRTATGGRADRDPLWAADQIEEKILYEHPDTVAAVILEPLQNAGGCIPPQDGYFQRVREICDRHDVLLISDEVICAWGRLGYWFGCERYGYQPDIMTVAKALTSAYVPMGAADRV